MIKSRYMLTRIKYFKIFPSSYTYIVMTQYFYLMILKFICRYTKYLWIIKLSRTEVHFIFVFMSKLSYLPLLSMLKNSKNGVTFETTLSCPQSRWLGVFISLICRYNFFSLIHCCSVKQFCIQISHNKIESAILATMNHNRSTTLQT